MKRGLFTIAVFLWTLLHATTGMAYSKSYSVTVLNSDCGLSQHDCECILQDKLGFIWIGTYDGLNRFDGKNVVTFRHNPSVPNSIDDNRILALAEWPERDELWIGTDGGISCYNMRTDQFLPISKHPDLKNTNTSCLLKDGNKMWVGTSAGLFRLNVSADDNISVEHVPLFDGRQKISPHITTIGRDKAGNIYASTLTDLYVKALDDALFVKVLRFKYRIKQIYTDQRGLTWIISGNDICIYDPDKSSCIFPVNLSSLFEKHEQPCGLLAVTNSLYLLLSSKGIYWINANDDEYAVEPIYFNDDLFWRDNTMKSMMIDRALNVWITSAGDGVARFDLNSKAISHYDYHSNSNKTYIQKIFVDRHKRMWVATNDAVEVFDPTKSGTESIKVVAESVYDIYEDSSGIWLSSVSHIFYAPDGDFNKLINVQKLPGFSEARISIMGPYAITGNGNGIIWVGMRNGILRIQRKGDSYSFSLNEVVSSQQIKSVCNITSMFFQDYGGNEQSIFIGTKNVGLLRCSISDNGDLLNPLTVRQLFPECGNHIWTIKQVASGRIYVGTDCGLRELIKDTEGNRVLVSISDDERVNTYKIMSIIEDNKNNLWLSTSQGLLKYNPEHNSAEIFQASDGLSSNILCEGAWYNCDSNMLYAGSIRGIDVLDLSSLQPNNILPKTQITAIEVNSTALRPGNEFNGRMILSHTPEYTDNITLKHNENNFSIEFAAMHFSNPDKNTYQYILEGFDENWTKVDNNTHSATFTNIPPGQYNFKVKSTNCDGVLGDEERSLLVTIDTPIYQSWGAIIIYCLCGLGIVYGFIRYLSERQRKNRDNLMRQMNHKTEMEIAEAKINYNTNITHELRTPLSLIIAPLDELLSKKYPDDFLESRLKMIKTNADSLLLLIGQFLDFRKAVDAKMTLKIRRENLSEILSDIIKSFTASAEYKNITLEFCNNLSSDYCWCDRDIIKKICSNLLANAIKYSPEGSIVILHAGMSPDGCVKISVEDNGIGINEKYCDKIFDRFYQVPGTIGGTGIGLNLCKSLANLHKGTIDLVSHEGEGSIFTFSFPASKEIYSDNIIEDMLPDSYENEKTVEDGDGSYTDSKNKKVILVIEDNIELRNYIVQLLESDYKVLTAGNGQEGLNMTLNHIPDIVISDIMMPVMDGIEYTRKVRHDIRTSHIPIILLTAKVAVENEIEGLSYGADDYVMKPFNPQVLKLRIENLIKLTYVKAQNASKDSNNEAGTPTLNERERNFVDTLRQLVIDNMSVPGYGLDNICTAMGMSRMQLHRKITAILNLKPSQFIKEVKMKRAYSLLKDKGLNITETMYEVGYSNYSYFTKLFTEVNGISPREILGMQTRGDKKES